MVFSRYMVLLLFFLGCGPSEAQVPGGSGRSSPQDHSEARASRETELQRLPPPGHAWVIFESDTVVAEVARTSEEREMGLMYRESLPDGTGMLFVFPDAQIRSFWMRNTFIPLDIAYMDGELRIVDIQTMDPQTEDSHPSAQPAMFALEVPRGWFERMEIRVGALAQVVFGPG